MTAALDHHGTKDPFSKAAQKPQRSKRPAPLPLRLNEEERAALEQAADGMSLSRYIKGRIFDKTGKPKPSGRPMPVRDHVALAQVLGTHVVSLVGRHNHANQRILSCRRY